MCSNYIKENYYEPSERDTLGGGEGGGGLGGGGEGGGGLGGGGLGGGGLGGGGPKAYEHILTDGLMQRGIA